MRAMEDPNVVFSASAVAVFTCSDKAIVASFRLFSI